MFVNDLHAHNIVEVAHAMRSNPSMEPVSWSSTEQWAATLDWITHLSSRFIGMSRLNPVRVS